MRSVSMLELRQNAQGIIDQVRRGERVILTYRGKAVARIEPVDTAPAADDPFYGLADLADADTATLTNQEMDEILYGG